MDFTKGPGKRGHIVVDTLLLMMFLGRGTQNEYCVSMLRKLGNICWGHKMFLNKIRNIFCARKNVARACKGGEIRGTKTPNLSRYVVSLQVLGRCFAFFTLRDNLARQGEGCRGLLCRQQ